MLLLEDFEAVGQNMFMKSIRIDTGPEDLKRAVEVWYEEIEHTNAEVIKSYKQYECFIKKERS